MKKEGSARVPTSTGTPPTVYDMRYHKKIYVKCLAFNVVVIFWICNENAIYIIRFKKKMFCLDVS